MAVPSVRNTVGGRCQEGSRFSFAHLEFGTASWILLEAEIEG